MTFLQVTQSLLKGFAVTGLLFILTLLIAIPLGLAICFCSMSRFKPLRCVSKTFVWIIRGVPLMLQLFVIYYLPRYFSASGANFWGKLDNKLYFSYGIEFGGAFIATLIAFAINYACYFSEIYRGGIESVPRGQYEAGQVLGMTKSQIFFKVVLLQVVKRILAPMGNEFITLVKDTALARIIAIYEIVYVGESYIKKGLAWPLFYTAAFYLVFNGVLTVLFAKLEKKLNYFRG